MRPLEKLSLNSPIQFPTDAGGCLYDPRVREMLQVAPRTITGLIDNLERDGWVSRVHDGSDRRSIQAQLTKKGLDQVLSIRREAVRLQAAATRGLTADELVQLRHLCLRVIQNMDKVQGA